jgi:hypothetical protein
MELMKDVEPRMRTELKGADALRTAGMAGTFRLRIFLFALYALCASVASLNAFAQGCAMCYTTAAAAGPGAARALDLGILVLLVPTLVLFVSVLGFAIRRAAATESDAESLGNRVGDAGDLLGAEFGVHRQREYLAGGALGHGQVAAFVAEGSVDRL